jgi:hypothetical protein
VRTFKESFTMPIRFSTEAANADILGEDKDGGIAKDGSPERAGADGNPAEPGATSPRREPRRARKDDGEAKPGQDINAAGFIKDKDAGQP